VAVEHAPQVAGADKFGQRLARRQGDFAAPLERIFG